MKKKVLTIFLATMLSLSVVACSNASDKGSSSGSSSAKQSESQDKGSKDAASEKQSEDIQFGKVATLKQISARLSKGADQTVIALKTKGKDEFFILQGPTADTSGVPFISVDEPETPSEPDPFVGNYEYRSLLYPSAQQIEFSFEKHELVYFTDDVASLQVAFYEIDDPSHPYAAPFLLSRTNPSSIYYGDRNPYAPNDNRSPKAFFNASLLSSNQSIPAANDGSCITISDLTVNGTPIGELADRFGDDNGDGIYDYLLMPSDAPVEIKGTYDGSAFEATFSPAIRANYDDDFESIAEYCETGTDGYATCHLEKIKDELLNEFSKNEYARLVIGNTLLYFTED